MAIQSLFSDAAKIVFFGMLTFRYSHRMSFISAKVWTS